VRETSRSVLSLGWPIMNLLGRLSSMAVPSTIKSRAVSNGFLNWLCCSHFDTHLSHATDDLRTLAFIPGEPLHASVHAGPPRKERNACDLLLNGESRGNFTARLARGIAGFVSRARPTLHARWLRASECRPRIEERPVRENSRHPSPRTRQTRGRCCFSDPPETQKTQADWRRNRSYSRSGSRRP
jgi:hypothetical protein